MKHLFENDHIYIEVHESPLPWVKVFTTHPYKELSEVPAETKARLFGALDVIEKEMIKTFNPTKINIASFGNYLPHVHLHIMARFENDTHFPEPMWGEPQREEGYFPAKEILTKFYSGLSEQLNCKNEI